ncbi:MAG: hypothetical protein J0G32_00790 [Alphaproteobacteria bacterium]|nr:hypothetical protein [Alphaproteobacteria bacterium]
MMAFAFFFLYVSIKYLQFSIIDDSAPLFMITEILWSQEDQAIFAGIISFYFGQRSLAKFRK